jgi:nucleoside-diphosphate-sugar epimerase
VGWPDATLSLLVRERARAERIGLPAASLIEGSLDATLAPRGVFAGVDVAVHLAGAVKARASDELMQSNAAGTAQLLAALPREARVVLVSSLAAAGPSRDGAGTDAPPDACRPCSVYGESKRQGELALLADAARTGRPWLVLRPCLVYGPGDGATRLLFKQARAPLCFVPWCARPLSTIHVSDVTAALVAAIERTDARAAFLPIAGEVTDTHALLRAIAEACGRHARLVRIPDALAALAGCAADVVARVRGTASYFSRDKVREILAPGWVANRESARAVLGFEAKVGLAEGLLRSALA